MTDELEFFYMEFMFDLIVLSKTVNLLPFYR